MVPPTDLRENRAHLNSTWRRGVARLGPNITHSIPPQLWFCSENKVTNGWTYVWSGNKLSQWYICLVKPKLHSSRGPSDTFVGNESYAGNTVWRQPQGYRGLEFVWIRI